MTSEQRKAVGENAKVLRKALYLTQQEVADRAGVTVRTVQVVETETRPISPYTVRKIAEALGVTPDDLQSEEVAA